MDFSKLPNLNALRAFESAARLESFSRAAEELFVTHGAVSHRIRSLEEDLGLPLFVRDGKRVRLTECGRVYAQQVRLAMSDIAHATEAIRAGDRDRRLIVSVLPSFAARWLMPRVGRFIESYPEIDLELMAATALVDFRRDNAPGFQQGQLPQRPADLLNLPLLRSDDEPWSEWFKSAGLPNVLEPTRGAWFNDGSMILQSVLDGNGIALVRRALAHDHLVSGRLIKLFNIESPSPNTYYFVCPEHVASTPRVVAFKTWLQAEVRDFHVALGIAQT